MDFHLYATFAIIALTIVAFAVERWPMEGVSLGALTAIILLFGLFPYTPQNADEALGMSDLLAGFADPALATVLALLSRCKTSPVRKARPLCPPNLPRVKVDLEPR
mgnify:CR=1 FL=1